MKGHTEYVEMSKLKVSCRSIYRVMGYGSALPDEATLQIVEESLARAYEIVRPCYYYTIAPCGLDKKSLNVEGRAMQCGEKIISLLQGSDSVALFVATIGWQYQEWLDEVSSSGDILQMFVIDAIGSAIVEAVGDYMELDLQDHIGDLQHTRRFNPGYCGWDIREQQKLFSLLPARVCDIELTESSLMHPIKSISGVVGVGTKVDTKTYGCAICSNINCYLRKYRS